ncbi:MAG: hypothetical protein PHV20_09075 [Bacteroidales bacterium]|nr:hypothetical protein [Bacteroidales bacterium]
MKNYLRIFVFVLLGLILGLNGYSQTGFSVHAGPSIIFRNNDLKSTSLKEGGLNLSFQYQKPINEKLNFEIDFDYLFNNYKLYSIPDELFRFHGKRKVPTREFLPISNIPLTVGFSLHAPFYEESEFFTSVALGGDLMIVPKIDYYDEFNNFHTFERETYFKKCLKLRVGIITDETYYISLNYFVLFGGPLDSINEFEFTEVPQVSLTIGYAFN